MSTEVDTTAAVNHLLGESAGNWRWNLVTNRRKKTESLVDWCFLNVDNSKLDQPYVVVNNLTQLAKADVELKKECGSIFIMLLGNLLIQLFILWLKKRLEN